MTWREGGVEKRRVDEHFHPNETYAKGDKGRMKSKVSRVPDEAVKFPLKRMSNSTRFAFHDCSGVVQELYAVSSPHPYSRPFTDPGPRACSHSHSRPREHLRAGLEATEAELEAALREGHRGQRALGL
eukprot:6089154-Pleurochrysis_carterae.AAC.1